MRAISHLSQPPKSMRQLCVACSQRLKFLAKKMPLEMYGVIRRLTSHLLDHSSANTASPDSSSASALLSKEAAHREQRALEGRTAQCMCIVR